MLIVCTVVVKAVKIKKASRVAARGQHEHHSRPLWDGETGYIDISEGCAVDIMHRRLVALVDLGHKSAFDLLLKEAWNPEQAAMGNVPRYSTEAVFRMLIYVESSFLL